MNEEFAINLKTILDESSIANVKKQLEDLKGSIQASVQNATAPATTATNNFDVIGVKEYTAQMRLLESQIESVEEGLKAMYERPDLWSEDAILKAEADLEKLWNKLIQLQTASLGKLPKNMKETEEETEETVSYFSYFEESVVKTKDEMQGLFKGALRLGMALIGVRGVYTSIRKAMGAYLAQNTKLQNKINACWYALGSLFAPVLEFIVDLFVKLVSLINAFVKALGFAGINMSKYGKAASKASKQLAGFDEINNLSKQSGASNPFGNFDLGDKFKDWIALIQGNIDLLKLMGIGAMFGIGVAFLFSGHPAIGLGMILASGYLAYKEVYQNWDYIVQKVGGTKNAILALLAGFTFGLGVVLLLSGNLIGLGLIASSLAVAETMLDWNYLPKEVAKTVAKVLKVVGAATAAIGIIALVVGFGTGNIGLALAGLLMMLGGAGMVVGSDNVFDSDALAGTVESQLEAVEDVVNKDFPKIDQAYERGMDGLESDTQVSMANINSTISSGMGSAGRTFGSGMDKMKTTNRSAWTEIWNTVKEKASVVVSSVKTSLSNSWSAIKEKTASISASIGTFVNSAGSKLKGIWSEFTSGTKRDWESAKATISSKMGTIKSDLATKLSNLKSTISNSGLGRALQNLFSGINPVIKPKVELPVVQGYTNGGSLYWNQTGSKVTMMAYAAGTNYVPNDQLALLHKGEAVIPAEYNGTQGAPYSGSETNDLLRELINVVDSKEFKAYISQNEIGRTAVKYINTQSRIQGGSVV